MGRLIYGYVKGAIFFMPFYDSEAIERARQVDLLTYLQTCELQELVHVSGNVYCTRTHDSLRISNGKWCWFSRGIGGYSALDYLCLLYTSTALGRRGTNPMTQKMLGSWGMTR